MSAFIASGIFGVAGLVPAFWAVTATVAEERAKLALSVPARVYLSFVPVTVAAHPNPRTPESVPILRVTS